MVIELYNQINVLMQLADEARAKRVRFNKMALKSDAKIIIL